MDTYQINILNPKAVALLKNLADLNLISLKKTNTPDFKNVLSKVREKAIEPPSLEEITNEVDSVRSKRYGSKKG